MPSVHDISITPVKGLALQHPGEVRLTRCGVEENRRLHLVDAAGRLFNGKHVGVIVRVRAELVGERLTLVLPGGAVVDAQIALGDAVETSFYGRPVAGRVVAGPWAEALSKLVGEPIRLVWTDEPGEAVDLPLSTLLSLASCEELGRRLGADVDFRRFRMLFTLAGCEPHEEDAWHGRAVRIGEAIVRVGDPVGRCVVTTRNPDTGEVDMDTLRAIKSYRGSDEQRISFGVYAEVEQEGWVRVGDDVTPL